MCIVTTDRQKVGLLARGWGVSSEHQNNGWFLAGLLARLVGSDLPTLVISAVAM